LTLATGIVPCGKPDGAERKVDVVDRTRSQFLAQDQRLRQRVTFWKAGEEASSSGCRIVKYRVCYSYRDAVCAYGVRGIDDLEALEDDRSAANEASHKLLEV